MNQALQLQRVLIRILLQNVKAKNHLVRPFNHLNKREKKQAQLIRDHCTTFNIRQYVLQDGYNGTEKKTQQLLELFRGSESLTGKVHNL
ncbi:hypothetical protein DBV15_03292 [Temnothorax longispinosus]|uniref:Uncharacterized protein n=1 Tax=Temnothorax longispinosus TaxID=300112 RepID=A0A4S2JR46_9HYME|nr:hypothetical protein DBV15_03292 [Temnothorax longispinosus]